MTVLHHIVSELFDSFDYVTNDDINIIKLLLKHNADPNIQDKLGRTPIMCFIPDDIIYSRKHQIFDILKECTNLKLKDINGKTFYDKYNEIEKD